MPHYDLSTYLADDSLTLQGVVSNAHPDGAAYTIPSPSAKMALRLHHVMGVWAARDMTTAPTPEAIAELMALTTDEDTGEPVDFRVKLMGDAYQQMVDDGVSADRLDMITTLVVTHYGQGASVARMLVDATSGEPQAPNRKARRVGAKAGRNSRQASTGTATRTRRPASPDSSTSPNESAGQAKAV